MKFKQATAENVAADKSKMVNDIPAEEVEALVEKVDKVVETKDAKAITAVNLRLSPSLQGEILCTLFPQIKVKVKEIPGNKEWYALTYQGRDCFVKSEFMKLV